MKMRFRNDGWHYADLKTYDWTWDGEGEKCYGKTYRDSPDYETAKLAWEAAPKAEPGDVWRIRWHSNEGEPEGAIAGYAICCPGCGHVHHWTTANNCNQKVQRSYVDTTTGQTVNYNSCVHSGVGSCWNWSGSAEENNLTASPSLQVIAIHPGDCSWHGFIQGGDLHT